MRVNVLVGEPIRVVVTVLQIDLEGLRAVDVLVRRERLTVALGRFGTIAEIARLGGRLRWVRDGIIARFDGLCAGGNNDRIESGGFLSTS